MNFKINDVIKEKEAETIYLYKILELRKYGYWCAKGIIERDAFIENGEYVSINYMNEDKFCNINSYDMCMNKNFPTYADITDVKMHDIIALKKQGKTNQEISNTTNCSLSNVEVVLLTYDYMETMNFHKDELSILREKNKALQQELDAVYKAVARRFLSSKELNF